MHNSVPDLFSFPSAPYLTLAVGIVPIFIEAYSVYEKSDKKRKQDIEVALENIIELAKTKGDTVAIIEKLKSRLPREDNHNDEEEDRQDR